MGKNSRFCRVVIGAVVISAAPTMVAHAGDEVVASKSLTIQSAGPRQGAAGGNYFNVQGKNKEKFAGFGVLVFRVPKGDEKAEFTNLTLTLVQSVPSFSSDGKISFFLAHPTDPDSLSLEKLKYDPTAARGLPKDAFKSLIPLGSGAFKKVETGKVDTFLLALDETARDELHHVIKGGGTLHFLVAPEDDNVAATYFGAGNEAEANRPRIKLGGEAPK